MPAVELARLQQEAAQLSEHFADPQTYLRAVEKLLQAYSVTIHRQGRVRGLRPVLLSYEVPPPLLKQIQLEMTMQAKQSPTHALAIADALWARRTVETRLLAARLLGHIPIEDTNEITKRLQAWALENREEFLVPELSGASTLYLCQKDPNALVAFAAKFILSDEPRQQILALGALQTLLANNHFENLPAIFAVLASLTADPTKKLRLYLADLLGVLAQRSPKETLYFLQQRLAESPGNETQWVARQVLKSFPEDERQQLRQALRP